MCLAAALIGGGVGYWFGQPEALALPIAPPSTERVHFDKAIEDMRLLTRSVDSLLRELKDARPQVGPDQRIPHGERSVVLQEGEDGKAVAELIKNLSQALERLARSGQATMFEALRVARLQRPSPDFPAVAAVRERLGSDAKEERMAAKREWLLLPMDDVVRRLGSPSNILTRNDDQDYQGWEYIFPNGDTLLVEFQNSLVVSVRD